MFNMKYLHYCPEKILFLSGGIGFLFPNLLLDRRVQKPGMPSLEESIGFVFGRRESAFREDTSDTRDVGADAY